MDEKKLVGLTDRQREFVLAIEANTEGLTAVSTGICGGCDECRKDYYVDGKIVETIEEFDELVSSGKVCNEPFSSWQGCDLCGSSLGGDFEPWHAIDANGELIHGERACVDCVMHLANGDLPNDEDD